MHKESFLEGVAKGFLQGQAVTQQWVIQILVKQGLSLQEMTEWTGLSPQEIQNLKLKSFRKPYLVKFQ